MVHVFTFFSYCIAKTKPTFAVILLFICGLTNYSVIAQNNPVNGFVVDANKDTIQAHIIIKKSSNTPQFFEFTKKGDAAVYNTDNLKVTEISLTDGTTYKFEKIQVDKFFSKDIGKLGKSREPVTESKRAFVEVIAKGKIEIAKFVNGDLERFYLRNENGNLDMLVYLEYYYNSGIVKNETYKYQLKMKLADADFSPSRFDKLRYKQSSILGLINDYYEATEGTSTYINFDKNKDFSLSEFLSIQVRPGLRVNSLFLNTNREGAEDIDFGTKLGGRLGFAFQLTPFGSERFSLVFEPTFQHFKSSARVQERDFSVNYVSLELAVGFRYDLWNNEDRKIYVSPFVIYDAPIKSDADVDFVLRTPPTSIDATVNFSLGVGYQLNNTYSVELQYMSSRNFINTSSPLSGSYDSISVVFGYTIF